MAVRAGVKQAGLELRIVVGDVEGADVRGVY
jgi:hypothetical protein